MYIILSLSKLANCYEHTRRKKLRTLKIVRKPFIYLKKKSGHQNFGKMEKKIDWCTAHKLHTENLNCLAAALIEFIKMFPKKYTFTATFKA